jgi:hypothetical protein
MPENIHYTDFANNIREYYPNFKEGNNDFELVQNFLAQYPQYRGGISFDVKPSKGKGKTTPAQTQAPSNRVDLFQGAQDVPPYLQQIGAGISRSAQQVPEFADTRIDAALQYSNKFAKKKGEPDITRENITPQNILDYTTYNIKKSVAGSEGPSTRINAVTAANDIYFRNLSKTASEKYGIDLNELINSEDPIEQDYVQAADMSSQLKLLAEQYRNAGDMATYKDFTQQAGLLDGYTGELSKDPNLSRRISAKAEFFPKIEGMAKDSKLKVDAIKIDATVKKLASDAMDYGFVPTKFAKEIARDYIGGTMYWVADLFGSDKVKNFVLNSPILSKDPLYQDEQFMSPKEPGKDIQWDRVPGFVYKQTLNMIPAIAGGMALGPAVGTALANVAGVARGTAAATNIVRGTTVGARMLGTALTTYDDAIYELDQAASKSGSYISPSQKSMLASAATIKTAAIESLNPLDRAFKGGLIKNFAGSAVNALATGKGFRYAMLNGANALTQAAKVGGLEIGEELLDETVQRGINAYSNEVLGLEGTPGVLKEEIPTAQEYADITINTLIATTPFMGAGAISASSNFRNDAFHSVSRQGLADKFLLKMEENIDQIGAKKFKAISNELQKVNNAYKGIPKEYDEDAARAIADKSIQIEELKDQLNGAPSQVIKDKIKAKIQSLENEILDIDATQEKAVASGEQPPFYSPAQTTLAASDQEDGNVLRIVSERVEPLFQPLVQRMTNAEEIDMNEIESVAEQMIDEQSRILESETLSETEKSALSQLIESQIDNLLDYEFATITTTEQTGQGIEVKGVVRAAKPGLPQKVSAERFHGATVTDPKTGEKRIVVLRKVPITQSRSGLVYQIAPKSFSGKLLSSPENQQVVSEEEAKSTPFSNMEYVSSVFDDAGNFMGVILRDAKTGEEIQLDNSFQPGSKSTQGEMMGWNELALDIAIAESQKQIGTVPEGAFISTIQRVVPVEQVKKIFPNLRETGTTPAAVGVEPQTEQDVRQETNAPQEGRAQGENAAPVPQEEGRQEGQVAPTAVEQEGETPPATEQKAPTTEEAIKGMAKSAKSAESLAKELENALNAMKVKIDRGAAREATFMIPALVYNGAIDAAILAVKAGKTVVDAVNVAVKYINENFDGEWDNGGFLDKLSVDLTKPMESYVLYKDAKAKGREPVVGQKVGVRFNLSVLDYGRKGVLSVHDKTFNGDVIDMVKASTVNNVKFSASKSGAKKIKEGESNKFPMASVDGSFVSNDVDESVVENGQRVFFNPKITDFFYDKDGREVLSASRATVDGPKVFAEGLKYGDRVVDLTQQQAQAETKATRKAKTVFHSGTLEGKGNIYVSPIREQANEYSSMSGAPVLEFEINENAMAPESEVRDLIRSLGLKLPEGYNLDELFLYEALDTRVKSSLSQGDIDKLYAALKDKGYEGIAFRDEDIRGIKKEGIDNFIVFEKISLNQQQAQTEAKPAKTIAEQRKEGVKSAAQKAAKSFNNWITGGGNKLSIANLPEQDAERFAQLVKDIGVLAEALVESGMTRAETALRAIKPYFETNYSEWLRLANVYFKSEFNLALIQKYPEVYKRGQKLQKEFDKTLKQRDALLAKDIEEAKAEIIGKIKSRLNPSNWATKTKAKLAKTRLTPESISDLKAYSKLFTDEDLSEMDPKMLKELYKEIDQIYKSGRRSQIANNKVLNEQARNLRQRSVISVGKSLGLTESVSSYEIAKKKAQRPGVRFYIMLNSDPNVIQEVDRKDIDSWKDFFGAKGFTTIAIDVNANTSSKQKGLLGKLKSGINAMAINNLFDTRNIMALLANDEDAFNMFEKNFIDLIYKSDFERDELKNTIGRFDSIAQKLKQNGYDIGKKEKSIVLRLGDNNAEGTNEDGLTIGQIIDVFMMLRDPDALVRAGGEGLVNYNQEDINKIIDYVLSNKPVLDAVEEVTAKYQDVLQEYILPTLSTFGYDVEKFNTRTYNTNGSFSKNDVENARAIEILNKVYSNNIPQSVPYSPLSVFSGEEMIGNDYDVTDPSQKEKAISVLSNNVISRIGGGQLQFGNVANKYNNYMNGMIDMVTRMPVLHNAQAIFSKDVSRLIENKLGESATKAIKNNINRVVTNRLSVSEEGSSIGPAISNWINRAVLGQMFINTRSAVFQPIATLNYAAVATDIEEYVKSTGRMLSPNNFAETIKEILNQPWVKERFGGKIFSIDAKELDERTKEGQPIYWTITDQLLKAGYTLTAAGDLSSIFVGGSPLYDSVKNKKYNEYIKTMSEKNAEAQSIKDASLALYKATNESQQSSNNLLISNAQKNPLVRLLLSFTTANQQLLRRAILAGQMMKIGVGSPQRNAYTILQFGMINAALFTLVSRTPELLFGLFDDDEDDMKKKKKKDALKDKYINDVLGGLMSGLGAPGVLLYGSMRGLLPELVSDEKFDKVTGVERLYRLQKNLSESVSASAPGVSIKLRQLTDAAKATKEGEYLKSAASAISFGTGFPTARLYDLYGQAAETATRDYTGMERFLRATDIYNKGWAERNYEEQVLRGKTPALSKIEEKEIKDKNTKELNELMRDLGFRAASQNEAGMKASIEKVKKYSEYAAKNYSLTKDQYETLVENFNKGYFAGTLPKEFVDYGRMSSQTKVEEIAKKINSFENDLERQEYLLKLDSANANRTLFSASEVKRIKELIE